MAETSLRERIELATKTARLASPEWIALIRAVRDGKTFAELRPFAAAAMFSLSELSPLRVAVLGMATAKKAAATAPRLEKQAAELAAAVARLADEHGQARCDDDRRAIEGKIAALQGAQRGMREELISARLAVPRLSAWQREYGLTE